MAVALNTLFRQKSPSLAAKNFFRATRLPKILPSSFLVEEERSPYGLDDYCLLDPGQRLGDRYEVISKLGWGSTSTVWLAREVPRWFWQSERYVALKVGLKEQERETKHQSEPSFEVGSEEKLYMRIAETNPSHPGYGCIRRVYETFTVDSPRGKHTCMVSELMREPLWHFRSRLVDGKLSLPLTRVYVGWILHALDYLHSECQIIHTDIKEDNLLMPIEDPSVLSTYVQRQNDSPMDMKSKKDGNVYLSHNEFGALKSLRILPQLADFGSARDARSNEQIFIHPIQPIAYRAPEVILGSGWSYSADIWNLGVVLWNMLEDKDLFDEIRTEGRYDAAKHLGMMIALLGPPPKELLQQSIQARKWKWSPKFLSIKGELCDNVNDYHGGPFFNDDGDFLFPHLIPRSLDLQNTLPSIEDKERDEFVAFVLKMLRWLPHERKTAKELINDPWLSGVFTN